MKNIMKRMMAFAVVLIMVCGLMACGKDMSDSPYVGTWVGVSAEYSGITLSVADVLGGEFSIELKDDGSCTVTVADQTENGKWDETEKGFIVDGELEFPVEGNVSVLDYDGVAITFEKQ